MHKTNAGVDRKEVRRKMREKIEFEERREMQKIEKMFRR